LGKDEIRRLRAGVGTFFCTMFYNAREFSHHIHTTGETIMTQDELKKQ
jgi:ribose 5-phosphate isomerase A